MRTKLFKDQNATEAMLIESCMRQAILRASDGFDNERAEEAAAKALESVTWAKVAKHIPEAMFAWGKDGSNEDIIQHALYLWLNKNRIVASRLCGPHAQVEVDVDLGDEYLNI